MTEKDDQPRIWDCPVCQSTLYADSRIAMLPVIRSHTLDVHHYSLDLSSISRMRDQLIEQDKVLL